MDWDVIGLIVVALVFGALGMHMLIRPEPLVHMYERMAAGSTDVLAAANRRIFDSARSKRNERTFRLVGAVWLLFLLVFSVILWIGR